MKKRVKIRVVEMQVLDKRRLVFLVKANGDTWVTGHSQLAFWGFQPIPRPPGVNDDWGDTYYGLKEWNDKAIRKVIEHIAYHLESMPNPPLVLKHGDYEVTVEANYEIKEEK